MSHLSDSALALIQVPFHLRELVFFLHQALFQIADLERDHALAHEEPVVLPSIPPFLTTSSTDIDGVHS